MLHPFRSAGRFLKSQVHVSSTSRSLKLSTVRPAAASFTPNIHRSSLNTPRSFTKKPQFLVVEASNTATRRPNRVPPTTPSKRTPDLCTCHNIADYIEKLREEDGFRSWGFVLYRCTYKSDSDWEEFMSRFLWHVKAILEDYNGLDLLDSFAPTVLEDKSLFDGATTSVVREYFKQWRIIASQQEQGIPFQRTEWAESGRYKFCLMVNEEALQSVLNAPPLDRSNETGFVILINGSWVPEVLDEEELAAYDSPPPDDDYDPLEGCTLRDVGWMKVRYTRAEMNGSAYMCDNDDWQVQYRRPPEIGFGI